MLAQIEDRFEKFITDLETIVNIDSGSGYVPGLEAVRTFFQERFQKIGWMTVNHSFDDGSLLGVLLPEIGARRSNNVEQLGNNGRYPAEVRRS